MFTKIHLLDKVREDLSRAEETVVRGEADSSEIVCETK